jgi:putative hemolysin
MNEVFLVDVDSLVLKLTHGKKVPGFVLAFIKRLIHQDEFNAYFSQGKLGTEFLEGFLEYINATVEIIGEENIPADGRFTFASNHPLGMLETCAQAAFFSRKYNGKIAIPANDLMMSVKQVHEYLIPVNKLGGQGRDLAVALDQAFAGDKQMVYFPAGLCSRKIDGVIQDLPWKKTFITKSRQYHRDVVPIWFSGRNSPRFYRLDALRNFLRLKLNIAMLTLPSEVFKCRNKRFKMVIGKPIPWSTFTPARTDTEWAAYVREEVYKLKQD